MRAVIAAPTIAIQRVSGSADGPRPETIAPVTMPSGISPMIGTRRTGASVPWRPASPIASGARIVSDRTMPRIHSATSSGHGGPNVLYPSEPHEGVRSRW